MPIKSCVGTLPFIELFFIIFFEGFPYEYELNVVIDVIGLSLVPDPCLLNSIFTMKKGYLSYLFMKERVWGSGHYI